MFLPHFWPKHDAGFLLLPCHSVLTWSWYHTYGKWCPIKKCCAQQELPSLSGINYAQQELPSLSGDLLLISPLHGPIAAHVWSEPTLGGSPSAPYRQGLCQVSPTNGHPPEAQVWHSGRWSYTLRGSIATDPLLWTLRDPDSRGTLSSSHALEVRGLTTIPHNSQVPKRK